MAAGAESAVSVPDPDGSAAPFSSEAPEASSELRAPSELGRHQNWGRHRRRGRLQRWGDVLGRSYRRTSPTSPLCNEGQAARRDEERERRRQASISEISSSVNAVEMVNRIPALPRGTTGNPETFP